MGKLSKILLYGCLTLLMLVGCFSVSTLAFLDYGEISYVRAQVGTETPKPTQDLPPVGNSVIDSFGEVVDAIPPETNNMITGIIIWVIIIAISGLIIFMWVKL
jgi:hypothetical protein